MDLTQVAIKLIENPKASLLLAIIFLVMFTAPLGMFYHTATRIEASVDRLSAVISNCQMIKVREVAYDGLHP